MNYRLISIALAACACGSQHSQTSGAGKVDDAETRTFAKASNSFAFDLWHRLSPGGDENLVFSPASISVALAMTWAGARGETAKEMAEVMHFGNSAKALHNAASATLASMNDPERDSYQLRVANRLFGEQSFSFRDEFIAFSESRYHTPLKSLDFRREPNPSRQHINAWVEGQTEERIRDLLPEGSIGPDTALVLTNAIYFKGSWLSKFSESATYDAPFYPTATEANTVKMMNATGQYAYAKTPEFQIVELPYAGGELAMTLVLPTARHGLAMLESSMTSATLDAWTKLLKKREVEVSLPRFKLEPESAKLRASLQAMGMERAFSEALVGSDFGPMATLPNGRKLYISDVFHKAFIEVNEEGTEAAAATAVVMTATRASETGPPTLPSFRADQPFLFFVRNLNDGTVLFMGRVADPSQ